jgi:hypothetical protein
MRQFLFSLFMSSILFAGTQASAQISNSSLNNYQTVIVGSSTVIGNSETKSFPLKEAHYIKNLIIQAEGVGSDSMVEVMVNGEVKGTIHAPGRDPSYVVTIEDVTRSIEIRHVGAGGPMRIVQIMATMSQWYSNTPVSGGLNGDRNQVIALASRTLNLMTVLQRMATPSEFQTYLFPIKKSAGWVHIMSSAHGNLSKETIVKLVAMMDQIDFARPYLNQLMQKDEAFDAVVELLTVRETLADWLD